MFRKFIGEKYFCGLDIGSHTIKAGVIEPKENRQIELLGVYEVNTKGFEGGSVTDLGDLSSAINAALTGLMKNSRIKVRTVQLGIGGEVVRERRSSAVIPLLDRGNKVISQRDALKIQRQARLLGVKVDEVILHDFPQGYKVDDINRALNPVGLYGRKLEVETLVVAVKNTTIQNLSKAVSQAGFDVENVFFTTYAATRTVLDDFQQKQGCLFIDVGSSVTDIVIFKGGQLRLLDSIPLGGNDITQAVVRRLNINFDLAEDMKKSYAVVRHGEMDMNEEILIKREDGYAPVKKYVLADAVEPVVTDLVAMVKASLDHSGFFDRLNAGIVMSGGGALLSGLAERVEREIGLPVTMAKIDFSARRMHNASKFLSAVGLAHAGFDKSFGLFLKKTQYSHSIRGFFGRIKELYEEYF